MTDKFHYQDVFQTINIPKTERRLALKAKNLFDIASGVEPWNPNMYAHLSKTTDNENASQAFWDFENDEEHLYDRLTLTIMQRGLTIAIEHRNFYRNAEYMRKSLHISNGMSKVYSSDIIGRPDMGSAAEADILSFKQGFFQTTANLGLYSHIKSLRTDQNESNSASFASAA